MSDPLAPVEENKSGKTKTSKNSYSSRGAQKLGYAKAVRKQYNDYQAQLAAEKNKAKKRSLWSTIGSIVGTIVAVAAAPFTGGGSLALLGNAAVVGLGTYVAGKGGKELAEAGGTLGGDAERDDIEVDRFYDSDAAAANEAFKQFDDDIDSNLKNTAMWSAIGSGVLSSGLISKAAGKLGLTASKSSSLAGIGGTKYAARMGMGGIIPAGSTIAATVPPLVSKGIGTGVGSMAANLGMELYTGPQAEEYGFDSQQPNSRNLYNYNIV